MIQEHLPLHRDIRIENSGDVRGGVEREVCILSGGGDNATDIIVNCQEEQRWWVKFMVNCWRQINGDRI
jgi:hypothetical protein